MLVNLKTFGRKSEIRKSLKQRQASPKKRIRNKMKITVDLDQSIRTSSPLAMKVKATVPRTYDKDGFKLRAGCLCFKDETEREVLLVTSSRDRSNWVVPAGGIDPGEKPLEAAVRETYEEAGVEGTVCSCLGVFQNDKSKTRTYIYSLIVSNMVQPTEDKERRWFEVKDALIILKGRPIQQTYITTALNKKPCENKSLTLTPNVLAKFLVS